MTRNLSSAIAFACAALVIGVTGYAAPTQAAPRDMRPFRAESMDAIRKGQAGKPFVLSFWSVTCEPCRAEMAVWRAVKKAHPQLRIVLVSTDGIGERALAAKFLARYDPGPVELWGFDDEFVERVRYAVDPKWRGELPRSYLYDAAHTPEAHSGVVDEKTVKAWIARVAPTAR
jgi:thiol-disulfide isomerase/thioredoxin